MQAKVLKNYIKYTFSYFKRNLYYIRKNFATLPNRAIKPVITQDTVAHLEPYRRLAAMSQGGSREDE